MDPIILRAPTTITEAGAVGNLHLTERPEPPALCPEAGSRYDHRRSAVLAREQERNARIGGTCSADLCSPRRRGSCPTAPSGILREAQAVRAGHTCTGSAGWATTRSAVGASTPAAAERSAPRSEEHHEEAAATPAGPARAVSAQRVSAGSSPSWLCRRAQSCARSRVPTGCSSSATRSCARPIGTATWSLLSHRSGGQSPGAGELGCGRSDRAGVHVGVAAVGPHTLAPVGQPGRAAVRHALPPSPFCGLAVVTTTASNGPVLSISRCRLRPRTRVPAS